MTEALRHPTSTRIDGPAWSWRTYWASLALLSMMIGLWGLATPAFAMPDEPAHFLKAAGSTRLQWTGTDKPTAVTVPPSIAAVVSYPGCFAFQSQVTADCTTPLAEHDPAARDLYAITQAGRYPPLYYTLVGLPTLAWKDLAVVYAVRGMSGALCAAALAAAVTAAAGSGRRLLVAALGVGITPMAVFLASGVQPSGTETAGALALWTAGAVAVLRPGRPSRALLAAAGLGGVLLVLSRPVSPLWVALIGVTLILLGGWRRSGELLKDRAVQVWLGVLVLLGALQAALILRLGSLDLYGTGQELAVRERVDISLALTDDRLRQMVGWFGWLDTPAPDGVHVGWAAALVMLLVLGARRAVQPKVLALVLAVAAAVVVVPVALEVPGVDDVGFYWQGRYTLPLAGGVAVLAALVTRRREVPRPLVWLLLAGLAVGHAAAFSYALARYTVGLDQGIALSGGAWEPPLPALGLNLVFAAVAVAWALWLALLPLARLSPEPSAEQVRDDAVG